MKIRVPATSANIGPGFDSVGLAVTLYLEIDVIKESKEWYIEHDLKGVPNDATNLLISTALQIEPNLRPHYLKMTSSIPLARGLGSSSSVIVAGIELANQLGNLNLSIDEKLNLATKIEGHPDNVAPALLGNLVISQYCNERVQYIKTDFPETALLAYIPNYELKTSDSRQVLPQSLDYKEAVLASSTANVVVAALMSGNIVLAGKAIEQDQFHQPYRLKLVKEFNTVRDLSKASGAYGIYLSGAGPTLMILIEKSKVDQLKTKIEQLNLNGDLEILDIDKKGVQVV
ncbi:homoserine kinase [Streptococcus urinalis FB127-CNA-2]|uniref:Homoserine kinase n=1 Tax=Streptococcus urinalis 2285-97 TaxID=764291 RepID=G5KFN8_9STRE|nr:homoserine kinase [Streptococcus urinalis]EHJ56002.1 homoserine kinase [Streptococcus urinalis 2285-97]EKS22100.1 homoserine kinase [Streptococcus urinalis FB127-CNA-2]VEF31912.1 homoserine kinase [Streptococcus urinalis]